MSLIQVNVVGQVTRSLLSSLRPGDRATILTPHGQERTGRVVMKFATHHAVLNLGGAHGTPGIATDANLVRVSVKRDKPAAKTVRSQERAAESSWLESMGGAL
jgi:hypothetical protein